MSISETERSAGARFDPATHPLWHGFAPMSYVLSEAGPDDMWVRGDGCWLIDASGQRLLDARSGVGNMALGYSRSDIAEAMYRQALELPFVCTMRWEQAVPVVVEAAAELTAAAPDPLTRIRFTHTGSSATESALLMARTYQRNVAQRKKKLMVGLEGSYHGSTSMAMAASGQTIVHRYFGPMPEGFAHIPAPTPESCDRCQGDAEGEASCVTAMIEATEQLGADRIAAVIVEPVKGTSGVPLPDHYLAALRTLCDEHGILLIFDEVFTGFGRTGRLFAAELSGVAPDIMCLAKAITSGYAPLGAVLVNDTVYDAFNGSSGRSFAHASSTDAHPVSCAAALASLQAFHRDDVVARGRAMGARLAAGLEAGLASSPYLGQVRNLGAYVGLDLVGGDGRPMSMPTKRYLEAACRRRGVLIDYTPETIMLIPPLIMPDDEVDLVTTVLCEVIGELDEPRIDPATLRPGSLRGHR